MTAGRWADGCARWPATSSRRRRTRPTEVALDQQTLIDGQDEFSDVEAAEVINTMLRLLPRVHRDVFTEVYLRDRSVADVAVDLGIPPGTVKSRCHYARRHLQASFPAFVGTTT